MVVADDDVDSAGLCILDLVDGLDAAVEGDYEAETVATIAYSVSLNILSVIKNVDDAVRVVVYKNGEKTVYAKRTPIGDIEPGTTPFVSKDKVMSELYENFKPNDVDKYTVVVYLEGDDPQCINDILGGEMKMDMLIGENTLKYER